MSSSQRGIGGTLTDVEQRTSFFSIFWLPGWSSRWEITMSGDGARVDTITANRPCGLSPKI